MESDHGFRLSILSAIIKKHGPIPCIHVTSITTFDAPPPGVRYEPAANGYLPVVNQSRSIQFRCEASELRVGDDGVFLDLRDLTALMFQGSVDADAWANLQDNKEHCARFETSARACYTRDRLCERLKWLPWDRTPLGRCLDAEDVQVALRHIVSDRAGLKILHRSTPEISAQIFDEHWRELQDDVDGGR